MLHFQLLCNQPYRVYFIYYLDTQIIHFKFVQKNSRKGERAITMLSYNLFYSVSYVLEAEIGWQLLARNN